MVNAIIKKSKYPFWCSYKNVIYKPRIKTIYDEFCLYHEYGHTLIYSYGYLFPVIICIFYLVCVFFNLLFTFGLLGLLGLLGLFIFNKINKHIITEVFCDLVATVNLIDKPIVQEYLKLLYFMKSSDLATRDVYYRYYSVYLVYHIFKRWK